MTENMTRHECGCKVCKGAAILAPAGKISGTPRQVRELTHSYVAYAYGSSPIARVLTERAGIRKAV